MAKIEKFCRTYPDSNENAAPCSIADTIGWKLTRVLSYGHP